MGAGRSGLVAKAFAMRLMHLGTAGICCRRDNHPGAECRVILWSCFQVPGRTRTVADIAETAKEIGAKICLITFECGFKNRERYLIV